MVMESRERDLEALMEQVVVMSNKKKVPLSALL